MTPTRGGARIPSGPVPPDHPASIRRRGRPSSPLWWVLALALLIGSIGAVGVIRAADERTEDVERIVGLENVLAEVPDDDDLTIEYPAENYLLVGSDTRQGIDPDSEDFGVIGDASDVGGRRSDTIMVLRQEHNGGAALMSLPRDLWVEIAGTGRSGRINSAYNEGPERLAATVTQALGIPVHHYVEVDFVGFKDIIGVAAPAMRHRLRRSFEAEADGLTTDAIIERLLEHVPREASQDDVSTPQHA